MTNREEIKGLVKMIYKALDDRQGQDIRIIDIHDISVLADYFIIAHGNNVNHVESLKREVEDKLAKHDIYPEHLEGNKSGGWLLLDYASVIVHVFGQQERTFYDLERIWSDGKEIIDVDQL